MNEEAVRLWVQKAEDDLQAGKLLMQTENPITWIVCFHMQQCVEKYLKAFLIFHGREQPRTHNIPALVNLCAEIDPSFGQLKSRGVRELTRYAIIFRYGEEPYTPDQKETQRAIELAERTRSLVRQRLVQAGMVLEQE
ncbi:hypothetical protein HRbin15_01329 [bacterium HR15]|nr:hypothetical protein HRbin15_01329 [bacterium HR15]